LQYQARIFTAIYTNYILKKDKEAQRAQSQRLKDLIKALNISTTEFSRQIKRKQPFVSAVSNGRSGISKNLLESIAKRYTYINTRWLLTGEGAMFLSEKTQPKNVSEPGADYAREPLTLSDLERMVVQHEKRIADLETLIRDLQDKPPE